MLAQASRVTALRFRSGSPTPNLPGLPRPSLSGRHSLHLPCVWSGGGLPEARGLVFLGHGLGDGPGRDHMVLIVVVCFGPCL